MERRDSIMKTSWPPSAAAAARTSTRTSWKAICPAPLCHLANISYRLGTPQRFEPRQNIFADSANAQNTMIDMEEHLAENRVPLASTNLLVGRRLTVHPTNETIPGDEEASRMLTRLYRPGFVVPARV